MRNKKYIIHLYDAGRKNRILWNSFTVQLAMTPLSVRKHGRLFSKRLTPKPSRLRIGRTGLAPYLPYPP
jgi:hypothetical protein